MSWQEPKTDWAAGDVPGPGDFNRIEGNIQDLSNRSYNLSFEYDSDNDGIPDGWDFEALEGGSGTIDLINAAHGSKCFSIIHPGGAGKGGGALTSGFIPISKAPGNFLGVFLWSTVADIKNRIIINFYDIAGSLISDTIIYDSTTNATVATLFIIPMPAVPDTARYFKIKIIGGVDDTDVAGTTYIDGVEILTLPGLYSLAATCTIPELARSSTSYADVGSASINITSVYRYLNFPVTINFSAEVRNSASDFQAYMRFRIGTTYSNEKMHNTTSYTSATFTLTNITVANNEPLELIMQLRAGSGTAYGRKTADTSVVINPNMGAI